MLAWSFAYFATLLGGYYILRPVREALAVDGGMQRLSWMFTGTFVVMLLVTPAFGALVARWPRRRFVPWVYRFFLLHLVGFIALLHLDVGRTAVAYAYFIWLSVYNMFVVSVFWSVMADVFRSDQGKRLFGIIAGGGSAGALAGSWLTSALADRLGLTALLVLAAVLLECTVQCFHRVTRAAERARAAEHVTVRAAEHVTDRAAEHADASAGRRRAGETPAPASEPPVIGGGVLAGAVQVARSPYLAGICLYLVCTATASTFLYVHRAQIVERAFDSDETRAAFFALVDLLVNLCTLLLQLLVTARVLRRLGVGATLASLPALAVTGFLSLAVMPELAVLVAFQAALRASRYAMGRPARELLFTVVTREQKYKSKNFIDTVVFRAGDALASWSVRGLSALGLGLAGVALVTVPLAGVWLAAALLLGRAQDARARRIGPGGAPP